MTAWFFDVPNSQAYILVLADLWSDSDGSMARPPTTAACFRNEKDPTCRKVV